MQSCELDLLYAGWLDSQRQPLATLNCEYLKKGLEKAVV